MVHSGLGRQEFALAKADPQFGCGSIWGVLCALAVVFAGFKKVQ